MKTLIEFLKETASTEKYNVRPRIELNSGLSLSVQGNFGAYSSPKGSNFYNYSLMEVGYPSKEIESIIKFAEDKDDLTNTVYPYVPIEVINDIVNKNGGIK